MLGGHFSKISTTSSFNLCYNQVCVQSVRYARKPRWLPTAPSKVFRVPERHVLPHDESIEWQRLNNNYRTQINSLRRYLIKEVEEKKKNREMNATPADEEAEFQRCLAINESWNQDIAKMRTLRIEEENEKRREQILINIENKVERQQKQKEIVEEKIKREQKAAESFITRENIDQAIERALANPISYDFCIDLDGNRKGDSIVKEESKIIEEQQQP
ncbi:hypothetical protein PVAND_009908 [Polypedilum vanderplanki]|uniref:Small ribosomal subunit protein mS26 n=1 Tax=Polypedilum vanderplanki TaxID=319348 RepID=A0A9J6CEQ0_POLVA|nr:hypothetical protein PVAND_009908 [Polypedilum vanderplanki]